MAQQPPSPGEQVLSPGIVSNPHILGGKPLIEGTRISVELILTELSQGASVDELCEDYDLTKQQISDALGYTLTLLKQKGAVA